MSAAIELEALASFGEQPAYFAPLVRAIWPARAEEITALFTEGGSDLDAATDHPFAVKLDSVYVGITGFYLYDNQAVGLCWHGVVPGVRGRGVSRAAFDATCALAVEKYPSAKEIVELIPSDRDADLVPYFQKLGFRHRGEIATFDYLPKGPTWRVYRAPLVSRDDGVQR